MLRKPQSKWRILRLKPLTKLTLLIAIALLSSSCNFYRSYRVESRILPRKDSNYYAIQVEISQPLLKVLTENNCDYNSFVSWYAYFSPDPFGQMPSSQLTRLPINSFHEKSDRDLLIQLPYGVTLIQMLQNTNTVYRYPVITAHLKPKGQPPVPETPLPFLDQPLQLSQLPQLFEQGSSIFSYPRQAPGSPEDFPPGSPLYLNYLGMHGTTRRNGDTSMEFWQVPIILQPSDEQFQYLGKLIIDIDQRISPKIRYNKLLQANIIFRVEDHLDQWQGYLSERLSGGRITETKERSDDGYRYFPAIFKANLMQVRPSSLRVYPFSYFDVGQHLPCTQ